jgi:hypothetical protein
MNASADPWIDLSEFDPRFKQFFVSADRFLLHVHASNVAGMSDPLVIDVPLRPQAQGAGVGLDNDQVERMFEGLRQLAKNETELFSALNKFSVDQLKSLLRSQGAARLYSPAPPPSGMGNKTTLIERLMGLLRIK